MNESYFLLLNGTRAAALQDLRASCVAQEHSSTVWWIEVSAYKGLSYCEVVKDSLNETFSSSLERK